MQCAAELKYCAGVLGSLRGRSASSELRFCDLCLLHAFDSIFLSMFGPPVAVKWRFRSGKNCLVLVYSIHALSVVSQITVVCEVAESLQWYTAFLKIKMLQRSLKFLCRFRLLVNCFHN